jgi:hypothetical protein
MSAPVEPYNIPVAEGVETWEEHGLEVRWVAYEHRLEFRVRSYAETLPSGSSIWRREYMTEDENGVILPAPDFDKADRFIDGTIKWDGCAHVEFGDERGYLHLCDMEGIRFVLRSLYDLAIAKVPAFDPLPVDWSKS